MRIGHHVLAKCSFPRLRSPILSESDEKLLIAGETILRGHGFARERSFVSVIRRGNAGHVGDVFRQRLLAIYREIRKRSVGVILGGELCSGRLEMRKIGGSPPVTQAALGIECAAFGIKGVADFVPDDGTDGAIVGGGRGSRIIERRL